MADAEPGNTERDAPGPVGQGESADGPVWTVGRRSCLGDGANRHQSGSSSGH